MTSILQKVGLKKKVDPVEQAKVRKKLRSCNLSNRIENCRELLIDIP